MKLYELGMIHNIVLQDFIVIGYKEFYSFHEEGRFASFRKYNKYSH